MATLKKISPGSLRGSRPLGWETLLYSTTFILMRRRDKILSNIVIRVYTVLGRFEHTFTNDATATLSSHWHVDKVCYEVSVKHARRLTVWFSPRTSGFRYVPDVSTNSIRNTIHVLHIYTLFFHYNRVCTRDKNKIKK